MTEFEMAYLLTDMQSAIAVTFGSIATLVSGFLITGYVAGHRLNRVMIATLIAVYTWWFLLMAGLFNRQYANLAALVQEIHRFASAGKGLSWHTAAGKIPQDFLAVSDLLISTFTLLVFVASLIFFFQFRRMNLKAPAQSTALPVPATPTS